jgi:hypothetical protein
MILKKQRQHETSAGTDGCPRERERERERFNDSDIVHTSINCGNTTSIHKNSLFTEQQQQKFSSLGFHVTNVLYFMFI